MIDTEAKGKPIYDGWLPLRPKARDYTRAEDPLFQWALALAVGTECLGLRGPASLSPSLCTLILFTTSPSTTPLCPVSTVFSPKIGVIPWLVSLSV